jgi:predicted cupin superfamily sugar epimerase
MPLELDTPELVTVTTVRIVSFSCTVSPLTVTVVYQNGVSQPDGSFQSVTSGMAIFDQAQIETVDPDGTIYTSMKDALYQLLETVVGPGTID